MSAATDRPVTDDGRSDADLLKVARTGDRQAFGLLYDRHVRAVFWQAAGILRDHALAEDATQDVFVTMWRKLPGITPVDESVLPWLLTTAKYTALNALRLSQRRQGGELDEQRLADSRLSVVSAEDEAEAQAVRSAITEAVAALSPTDQQLYELCIEQELTYEQAARALGVNHGSVRNRLSRLRARLRTDLRAVKEAS